MIPIPGSEDAHARATLLAAVYGPSAKETLAHLCEGAQALLGLIEQLCHTRDANTAEQIAYQCDGLRRTAHRVRLALLAESAGVQADD